MQKGTKDIPNFRSFSILPMQKGQMEFKYVIHIHIFYHLTSLSTLLWSPILENFKKFPQDPEILCYVGIILKK